MSDTAVQEAPAATAPPRPAASSAHLDRSLVRGIAWTGGMKWATQLLSWCSTLVVARLLTPQDYGLVGMGTVYLGFVQMVNQFGLGGAIVQQRQLNREQISRIGGFAMLMALGCFAFSLAVAGPISRFFGEPAVRQIIALLSITFLTSAVQLVPRALLMRDLQYRQLALLDGVQALTLTLATLTYALLGLRYWSLVFGGLTGELVAVALALRWRAHPLALPRPFASIRGAVGFGGHLVVGRMAWYAYSNADTAVVGRLLGKSALGAYSFGWSIASIPVDRVSALIGSVTPSIFASLQGDRAALRRYLRTLTEGLALVTFPASVGLFLVGDDFVLLVLGETWRAAIAPLRLLALYAGVRSLTPLLPQILVATGHARRHMHYSILSALVMPVAFLVGSRWGVGGVALGWVIGYPLVVVPTYLRTALRLIGMRASEYLGALWPATGATLVMAAAVTLARAAAPAGWGVGLRFGSSVAVGAAAYVLVVVVFHGHRLRAFRGMLRETYRKP